MNSLELNTYKQNRISELTKLYNVNMLRLNTYLVNTIRSIQRSRYRSSIKQSQINAVIAKYNAEVATLRSKLNADIAKINAFSPTMLTNPTSKKALLIGCNYINTPYSLSGCMDDAERVKQMLVQHGFTHFQVLTDVSDMKPTKTNILREFKNLVMNATPGDSLFFYFSGHGSFMTDANRDETDGKDELIISTDLQAIKDDELRSILTAYMKDGVRLTSMFDSCHSGTMMDLKYTYLDSNNYDSYTENSNVTDCKGDIIMISGCMDSQTSAEGWIDNKPQGAMTWALLDSLQKFPSCSWRELIKAMRDSLQTGGYSQIPQISTGSFENMDAPVGL